MTKILGIDVGGSSFKGALVQTKTGRLLGEPYRVKVNAPCPITHGLDAAREIARHFHWKGPVGIGFPAMMRSGRIGALGNLGDHWEGKDGAALFTRALRSPTRLLNDADAAGLAEMKFGAGKGERGLVLMVTMGTGIGSALFYDGVLAPKVELGHVPWRGKAIEHYASAAARRRRGLDWSAWATRVNVFLAVAERMCAPDLIIIGGGVSQSSSEWLKYIKTRARVLNARMNNEAGIVGAALAWEYVGK